MVDQRGGGGVSDHRGSGGAGRRPDDRRPGGAGGRRPAVGRPIRIAAGPSQADSSASAHAAALAGSGKATATSDRACQPAAEPAIPRRSHDCGSARCNPTSGGRSSKPCFVHRAGPRLLQLVGGAGGNPLFVAEVVGGLTDVGAVQIDAHGCAETSATSLPASVTAAILQRLSFLTAETLHLLGLASILGGSFSVGELDGSPAAPVAALLARLREALRAASSRSRRRGWRFVTN